jgi:hypothetical protein
MTAGLFTATAVVFGLLHMRESRFMFIMIMVDGCV